MTNQDRVWKIGVWVGVLLAVFLAVLSIKQLKSIAYVGKSENIVNSISVNGKGEQVVIPDIATFSFGVNETAKTVTEAQTKATEKTNAALDAIRKAGIADKDIKTISYNINPQYEYQNGVCNTTICRPGKNVLTGYEVSQTIEVKIRDIEKAGSIFELIGSLGVQNVNSLQFSVDDIEEVKAEARKLAIEDAEKRAKELSDQLDVRLVRIISYYDNNDTPYPYYERSAVFAGKDAVANQAMPPEVPTGEQKIISSVNITYEIR